MKRDLGKSYNYPPDSFLPDMNSTTPSNTAVLIVEDDSAVRCFLTMALQHLGFHVTECSDVGSAEQILKNATPLLVLTDCNLPKRSGIDLIRWTQSERSDLPIVGMSAEHFKGVQMLDAGASDFLEKPIELHDLRAILEKHRHHASAGASTSEPALRPETPAA